MSLNSVVNNLVRAAASVPADISDTDLDAHVARLLANEAKANEMKWSELGLGAYLDSSGRDSPDPSLPKTNKRFLASVIRNVDGHNTALLRQQAESAREARSARLGEGPSSRRGMGAASRLFGGAVRDMGRDDRSRRRPERASEDRPHRQETRDHDDGHRDRDRSREKERERRRERGSSRDRSRDRDGRDGRDRSRDRDRRRDRDRSRDRSRDRDSDDRRERRHHDDSRRHREADRESKRERRDRDDDDDRRERRRRHREDAERPRRDRESRRDRSPEERRSARPLESPPSAMRNRSVSPARRAASPISRMDKYFAREYDPRFDVGEVPKEGPVTAVGWDNMLAILKDRGKKRRRHSPGLSASPEPERKSRHESSRHRDAVVSSRGTVSSDMKGMMEMEYTRKGGVREWDKGK